VVIEGRAAANDECSNVVKEKGKKANKQASDTDCALQTILSMRNKCKRTTRDARSRPAATVWIAPPPGVKRAEKKGIETTNAYAR
jgi:hypothetical protein